MVLGLSGDGLGKAAGNRIHVARIWDAWKRATNAPALAAPGREDNRGAASSVTINSGHFSRECPIRLPENCG